MVIDLFHKLVDIHNFELVLHTLTPLERANLICRVGLLNVFNPLKPEGAMEMNLARREEFIVAKMLSYLSSVESGPNLNYQKFFWNRESEVFFLFL